MPLDEDMKRRPFAMLARPPGGNLAGDQPSAGCRRRAALRCPRRAEDLLVELALGCSDDLLLMLRHVPSSRRACRARAIINEAAASQQARRSVFAQRKDFGQVSAAAIA
jgi:hypothetical protein